MRKRIVTPSESYRIVELTRERGNSAVEWDESHRPSRREALAYYLSVYTGTLRVALDDAGACGLRRCRTWSASNTGLIVRGTEIVAKVTFQSQAGKLVATVCDMKSNQSQTRQVVMPAAA